MDELPCLSSQVAVGQRKVQVCRARSLKLKRVQTDRELVWLLRMCQKGAGSRAYQLEELSRLRPRSPLGLDTGIEVLRYRAREGCMPEWMRTPWSRNDNVVERVLDPARHVDWKN